MVAPLTVSLSPAAADAGPGETVTTEVTVHNTSDIVEHYELLLEGLAEGDRSRVPDMPRLLPGQSASVTLQIWLCDEPPSPAGERIVGVVVRSVDREHVSRCEELALTVRPSPKLDLRVAPAVANGGRSAKFVVHVRNAGNTPSTVTLGSSDPENTVTATFKPIQLTLPPQGSGQARVKVRAPVPWGKEARRTITIETGTGDTAEVLFVQRPRRTPKAAKVVGITAAVLLGAAIVFFSTLLVVGAILEVAKDAGEGEQDEADRQPSAPATAPQATPTGAGTTTGATATTAAPRRTEAVPISFADRTPGPLGSNAYRGRGIVLGGAPPPDEEGACAGATALVVVDGDGQDNHLSAAPLDTAQQACEETPVQVTFVNGARDVRVWISNDSDIMQVFYGNGTNTMGSNRQASDDGRRGYIDYVLIIPSPGAPAGGLTRIRYVPAPDG